MSKMNEGLTFLFYSGGWETFKRVDTGKMSEGRAFKQGWRVGFHQHHLAAVGWNRTGGVGQGELCG